MSLFNAPRAPASQRSPFEGPAAGNQYEGFGGGAVGSVGGMNYGNTPWWMLPAGTQRNPSFMPVAQQPAPAAAPAMPPAPRAPVGGGPQDFFSALAGLLGGSQRPGQAGPYARPQMMQMSPDVMARMGGQGMLPASNRMAAMPSAGARPYTGPVGISEKLRPTEKNPTPWTKNKSWQDPRGNPMARPTPAPTMMPSPGTTPGTAPGPVQGSKRRGWTVEDFRAWARAAPGGDFM
jgi:hypothetical protein